MHESLFWMMKWVSDTVLTKSQSIVEHIKQLKLKSGTFFLYLNFKGRYAEKHGFWGFFSFLRFTPLKIEMSKDLSMFLVSLTL